METFQHPEELRDFEEVKKELSEYFIGNGNILNLELYRILGEHRDAATRIYPIITFIIGRIGTIADLTLQNKLWDAEIILRPVLESLMRLYFISWSKDSSLLLDEFWEDLMDIGLIKNSEDAKKMVGIFKDQDNIQLAFSGVILDQSLEKILVEKWPRKNRHKLEQKWSFSEIIAHLSKSSFKDQIPQFFGLIHNYRVCSHLSHGDALAISIINERESRNPEDKAVVEFGHYLRLISDCFSYSMAMCLAVSKYLQVTSELFFEILNDSKEKLHQVDLYQSLIYQDPSYDKFRL